MQEQVGQGALAKPSLSIIVPVFNPGQSLERLLGSLSDDERVDIIFVDDGSTDGSRERLAKYVENHRAVLVASPGKGPGTARNAGISLARGTFLAFADADDQCRLDVMLDAVDDCSRSGAHVGICGYALQGKLNLKKTFMPLSSRDTAAWVDGHSVLKERAAVWGKVYRREYLVDLGVLFPGGMGAEDVIFSYHLALSKPRTRAIKRIGYVYFQNSNEQLTSKSINVRDSFTTIDELACKAPISVDAKVLLGHVVVSSIPFFLTHNTVDAPGFLRVGGLVFRTTRVIGLRTMATSIKEVGKRQLTRWRLPNDTS